MKDFAGGIALFLIFFSPFLLEGVFHYIRYRLNPPKRQPLPSWDKPRTFHLSSAIVAMLVAAVFVGTNCVFRHRFLEEGYGWPEIFIARESDPMTIANFLTGAPRPTHWTTHFVPLFIDLCVLGYLMFIAVRIVNAVHHKLKALKAEQA